MAFETLEDRGVLVFRITERLKSHPETYKFLDDARKIISGGQKAVVIDLGAVEKVDSGGIGVLASLVTTADNAGAKLCFASIPRKVEKLIVLVGLMRVLDVYPTVEEAVAAIVGPA